MATTTNAQKITVTLPAPLLARLDELVPARQRSMFIARAIQEQLALLEQIEALDAAAGVWRDEAHPELADDAAMDAWLTHLRRGWQREMA